MNPFLRIKAHLESNLFHQQRIISTSPKDTTGREMDTCPSRASPSSKKKRGVYKKKKNRKVDRLSLSWANRFVGRGKMQEEEAKILLGFPPNSRPDPSQVLLLPHSSSILGFDCTIRVLARSLIAWYENFEF